MSNPTNEIIKFPFRQKTVNLIASGATAYIDVRDLCKTIGLNEEISMQRIEQQNDILKSKRIKVEQQNIYCLPLVHLSWFLLTAESEDPEVRHNLSYFQQDLITVLHYFWHRHLATNIKPTDFLNLTRDITQPASSYFPSVKEKIAKPKTGKPAQSKNKTPGSPNNRVNKKLVEEMRKLKAEGLSMSKIGRKLRVSPTTVCQCLNNKYPVELF